MLGSGGIRPVYQGARRSVKNCVSLTIRGDLKPAKRRGVVSQGMILAAGDGDVLALAALDRDVPPGTRIR